MCLVAAVALAPAPLHAFDMDDMFAEFDVRRLTVDEKRFLQTGLAFLGMYSGLIDGAWGQGSQSALEQYVRGRTPGGEPSLADAVLLAAQTTALVEVLGWQVTYDSYHDIALLVPTELWTRGEESETFRNFNIEATSIGISLARGDDAMMARLHAYTKGEVRTELYEVARPGVRITAGKIARDRVLYTRSDLRRAGWTTVMLSGNTDDSAMLSAMSASITPGRASPLQLGNGLLAQGLELARSLGTGTGGKASETVPIFPEPQPSGGFGTAFRVAEGGLFLTNWHVVEGCATLAVDGARAEVVAQDAAFDLALLRVTEGPGQPVASFSAAPARLNSDVTVAGFPLPDLLAGLNVTRGSVTALRGLGGDGLRMQISAPVQPGNSGGPVLGASGQVVGVVVSKLDTQEVARVTGDVPQNVNFAIRGEIAQLFLHQAGVVPLSAPPGPPLAPEALADIAVDLARLVACR
jgi:S1-C subfamily serine protease